MLRRRPAMIMRYNLSVDVLANIFSFLTPKDIMCKRRVCRKWREAVKKTFAPLTEYPHEFRVESVEEYNAMTVMTTEMPNLQQIMIGRVKGHQYSDGEDPDEAFVWINGEERAAATANLTTHDIRIVSSFSKLRMLGIKDSLNGKYPFLFNSFPLLQKLTIHFCKYLKFDLEMVAGLPLLKKLVFSTNPRLTGNISSLRVLKDTLEEVLIWRSDNVEGNFMDLADFPHLKELYLDDTAVTGDIRDIGENDFSSLEQLILPKGVYGCSGCECQRISEATDLMRAVYLLKKQHPALSLERWYAQLSKDSPDWYEAADGRLYDDDYVVWPPFQICFLQAGSRIGYRWEANKYHKRWLPAYRTPCEVNWLDPEPDTGSSDYAKYTEELEGINSEVHRQVDFYRGFHQPPTEEEYNRLCDDYAVESPLADESDLDE
jgi:hypothetical protein